MNEGLMQTEATGLMPGDREEKPQVMESILKKRREKMAYERLGIEPDDDVNE